MLLRSAARVTRNVSDTCTSGVPWHPCVTTSIFFLPVSARRYSCSLASSPFCVTWEKAAAPSNLWQRASLSQECLVKQKRSLSNCSRHSHLFPCSTCFPSSQSNTLLSFQKTLLRSPSFSSKPSSEEQPKVGIIARWFGFSGCKSCYHYPSQVQADDEGLLVCPHPRPCGNICCLVSFAFNVWMLFYRRRNFQVNCRFGGFYIMLKAGVDIVGFLEMIGTSQKVLDYMR